MQTVMQKRANNNVINGPQEMKFETCGLKNYLQILEI